MKRIIYCLCCIVLASCWGKKPSNYNDTEYYKRVMGWKPVYAIDSSVKKFTYFNQPRPIVKAGKIYVLGNTIFQNDINKGIHIINNTVPANAARVAFINLLGNTDMAIKGNFLYANNFTDMVVIDISNITQPTEVKRIKNAFNANNSSSAYIWQVPPDTGYFECPRNYFDSTVVSWVRDSVNKFCRKN